MPVNRVLYRPRFFNRETVVAQGRYSFLGGADPVLRAGGRGLTVTKRSNPGEYEVTMDGVGTAADLLGVDITPLETDTVFFRLDPLIAASTPRSIVFKAFNQPPESFDFELPDNPAPPPGPGIAAPERTVFKVYGANPVTTDTLVELVWDSAPAVAAADILNIIMRHRDAAGAQVGGNMLLRQITNAAPWGTAFTGMNANIAQIGMAIDETLTMSLEVQAGAPGATPRIYGRAVTQPNPVDIGTGANIIDALVTVYTWNTTSP